MFRFWFGFVIFYSRDPKKRSPSKKRDKKSGESAHISKTKSEMVCFGGFGMGEKSCWPGASELPRAKNTSHQRQTSIIYVTYAQGTATARRRAAWQIIYVSHKLCHQGTAHVGEARSTRGRNVNASNAITCGEGLAGCRCATPMTALCAVYFCCRAISESSTRRTLGLWEA